MLRIQMIGLAIVAAVAMSAIAAGSAFAAHEWLINGAAIANPVKIHSLGLLLLEDEGNGVAIQCHGFDAGTVGPGGADLVESITLELLGTKKSILCLYEKVPAFTCKENVMPVAEAINLPWKTELVLQGTEVRDLLLADGNGQPGYKVTCTNVLGGTTEDTCTQGAGEEGSTSLTNLTTGVLAEFEGKTPNANCSVGGAKKGKVRGPVLNENPSGTEKLSFD